MKDAQALEYARLAMRSWGVDTHPRLIKNRENAVFESVAPDGARAALRLHRPGYQSDMSIRSELWWSEALVAAGMQVPLPYRTQKDDVLARVAGAGRVASLVSWTEGTPLGEGDVPLAWAEVEQVRLHHALGAELARLHLASDAAELPVNFIRPTLDVEALLGEEPAWGRFWENPVLSRDEVALLQRARTTLREILDKHGPFDFGLIHADALRENVMVDRDAVRLIDFDDGVYGYRMYELGVAMSQNHAAPNRAALGAALLAGYRSARALPDNAETLLPGFTLLRGLASCGWVIGRYEGQSSGGAILCAARHRHGCRVFGFIVTGAQGPDPRPRCADRPLCRRFGRPPSVQLRSPTAARHVSKLRCRSASARSMPLFIVCTRCNLRSPLILASCT